MPVKDAKVKSGVRQGEDPEEHIELFPGVASFLASSVEPFEQQLLGFKLELVNAVRVVCNAVVLVMTPQLEVYHSHYALDPHKPVAFQPLVHFRELRAQLLSRSLPLHPEPAGYMAYGAEAGEPKEVESLWLAFPALFPVFRRKPAKLDQLCLVRLQLQPENGEPLPCRFQEPASVLLVLEGGDEIVGVDGKPAFPPACFLENQFEPHGKRIMHVDVGDHGRSKVPLSRAFFGWLPLAVFNNPCCGRLLDEPQDVGASQPELASSKAVSWAMLLKHDFMPASAI